MSAIRRVISGSLASWMRIAVTIVSQVVAVPIYLSYWSVNVYGMWILIQGIITFLTVFDVAHHQYLGNEFLKLGKQKRQEVGEVFCTGITVALIVSVFTFIIVSILVLSGTIGRWVGIEKVDSHGFEISLMLMAVTWALTVTFTGIIGRALYPFGYFPLSAWSGVVFALVSTIASIAAVCLGADLINATIVTCVVNFLCHSTLTLVLIRIARKENLFPNKIDLPLGFSRFFASLVLGVQSGLEILRQQGVRFILLPLSGMAPMIAFSTMRTGANLAQQGLATITAPLMPELMNFLSNRDQVRMEIGFSVIWLMLCVVLVPAILVLQYLSPTLFTFWTHGKIAFDPVLFAILSFGVVVSALAQPAIAVVSGNNLLKAQFLISFFAASITVGTMYAMVPVMGIKGAAIALLLGEVLTLVCYAYSARLWLVAAHMQWPKQAFLQASLSLVVAAAGMISIIVFSNHDGLCLIAALIAQAFVINRYWVQLPLMARQQAAARLARFWPLSQRGLSKQSVNNPG